MRVLVIPFLVMACGGSSQSAAPVAKPTERPADCAPVCNAVPLQVTAPAATNAPCDAPPGGLIGKVMVDGIVTRQPTRILVVSACARYTTTSNEKGVFSLPAIPAGVYVVASSIGTSAAAIADATVSSGEVVSMDITLRGDQVSQGVAELAAREQCGCPLH
jgi:hypothetical protein